MASRLFSRLKNALIAAALCSALWAQPQSQAKPEPLWPDRAPGAIGNEDVDRPTLTSYPASSPKGMTVIVCPGGGYTNLAMDHEGVQIAQWLNSLGISAFILKYRLGPRYHHPAMLQDAQRAIRTARSRGPSQHIGIWGFSAGGHLASTAGTHFDGGNPQASDPIERVSSRPDFMILAYPVISMNSEYTHKVSRLNLLGENPDPKLLDEFSNDQRVTPQTPPTFLFHTSDDAAVPVENSVRFYLALRKAGVPAEMHIYEHGRHGVGLAATDATLSSWPARLADWLRHQ